MKKLHSFALAVLTLLALGVRQPASAQCVSPDPSIISWWPAEGTAQDIVGDNYGEPMNGATYTTGKVGEEAFLFEQPLAAVGVGNPRDLQLQNFTIEGWVRRSSTSIVSSENDNGLFFGYGTGGYAFAIHPSGVLFLTWVGYSEADSSFTITNTAWHHVAVTANNGTIWCYLDGVGQLVSSSYSPDYTFTTSAAIGARGDNQDCSFYGAIDELSIYSAALSSSTIQGIYNAGSSGKCPPGGGQPPPCDTAPSGMVTWWKGEDNTLDSISGNYGTLLAGETYAAGEVGNAFSQGSAGSAVNVGMPSSIEFSTGSLTIEGWIKR